MGPAVHQEPAKQAMLDFESSGTVPKRQALVVMTHPPASNPIEMEVDLDSGCVLSHDKVSCSGAACHLIYFGEPF